MAIIHVRIDDRLIHGQVATMWITSLGVNRAMVVEDNADEILKMSLKMACPSGVALSVLSAEQASERILAGNYDAQRVFIVTKSPGTILRLKESGVPILEVNVGNISYKEGNVKISNQVALNGDDICTFQKLDELGVKLSLQLVPDKQAESFMELLKKKTT